MAARVTADLKGRARRGWRAGPCSYSPNSKLHFTRPPPAAYPDLHHVYVAQ